MDRATKLAERIYKARINRGLTQQELAERAGVSRYVVTGIETGRRQVGALELKDLAQSCGVSVASLLWGV